MGEIGVTRPVLLLLAGCLGGGGEEKVFAQKNPIATPNKTAREKGEHFLHVKSTHSNTLNVSY